MIDAEFLRKVSKKEVSALTCNQITDIDDKILIELLDKALWNAIDGDYCSHYILETTLNHIKEIKEILKRLGFKISTRILFNETDFTSAIFANIMINWKNGD